MKYFYCLLIIAFVSCKKEAIKIETPKLFKTVHIESIFMDSLVSIRALTLKEDSGFSFATSNGKIGNGLLNENGSVTVEISNSLKYDTIVPNFRSIAYNGKSVFTLSIASPALLYKDGNLVYKEENPKAFYDAMEFWNEKEGIAIGDPTGGCLSIIITRDAGETWKKIPCENLPKIKEGEAAFAASDTNIVIVDDNVWVATGGKSSRIFYSADKGMTWEVFNTPIIQGKETTGMYSLAFYDELNGFAIGGDYTDAHANSANKIITNDGGKTWKVVGENNMPGYRSCVQYIPKSNGKSLVAIGFKGIDVSHDAGENWSHVSDTSFYTLRFVNDSLAYAAGNGRVAKLLFK